MLDCDSSTAAPENPGASHGLSGPRVLLVTMPWAKPSGPSLALGLLKSALTREGLGCDVLYGNLHVGGHLSWEELSILGESGLSSLLMTPLAFDGVPVDRVIEGVFAGLARADRKAPAWRSPEALRELLDRCDRELDALAAHVAAGPYDIVGFSLVFEQSITSLALARRLKKLRPDVTIVLGGASCDGDMGPALLESFDFVDHTVSGDADNVIAPLVRALRAREGLERVPGLSRRDQGRIVVNPAAPTLHLDQLPIPDYSDFFEQLKRSPLARVIRNPSVPFESSRGCWWGEKHLCTFCGLNGTGLGFRRKSQERVIEEVMQLGETYRSVHLVAADNILDMQYFSKVVPHLAAERLDGRYDVSIFFEIKSNLKKPQVRALADAGVRFVQPGIESFSDHVLELMDKGATGIQQIQLLRWCEEYHIVALYNLIVRNPGETVEDYRIMTALVPFIAHMRPPTTDPITMKLQRFSPYFLNPARYGISNVRPDPILRATYRLDDTLLSRIAYNFEYDHADQQNDELGEAVREFSDAVARWRAGYRPFMLGYKRGPGFVRIVDQRGGSAPNGAPAPTRVVTLSGLQADIFLYCDAFHTYSAIRERFADVPEAELRAFLDRMVEQRYMWRDPKDRYLSLPIHQSHPEPVA